MKFIHKIIFAFLLAMPATIYGAVPGMEIPDAAIDAPDFQSVDELLYTEPADTKCASAVYADALSKTVGNLTHESPETDIQKWIYDTFRNADVLRRVVACPEIANAADDETIKFLPIEYTFPAGRQITVNYETQPKILKDLIKLATKRSAPGGDPNAAVGQDGAEWTSTNPAWYGIMITQHGALDNFVGPDKNNTISMKYINDHIDDLYPKGFYCTSKSTFTINPGSAEDIHSSVKRTVNVEDDSSYYYVAGDIDLGWIGYAEVAFDVALSLATMGGGIALQGTLKGLRAVNSLKKLKKSVNALRQVESVQKYTKLVSKTRAATKELDELKKLKQGIKNIKKLEKDIEKLKSNKKIQTDVKKAKELRDKEKELADLKKHNLDDIEKQINAKEKQLKDLDKGISDVKKDKDVQAYIKQSETFAELNKYRNTLRMSKLPAQRGNVIARGYRRARSIKRMIKAAHTGNKILGRGAKVARASAKSGKVRNWLFHSTLKNAGKLAKLEETGGALYGILVATGEFMYDFTDSSTGDFTNDIDFKPLLLLSGDDLPEQENVVNYGMWFMFAGDSISPADDDAAYLQALDMAEKIWQDLVEYQQEENSHECHVDIYVVHPIIRNPGDENAELYYLIMNEEPWTTEI